MVCNQLSDYKKWLYKPCFAAAVSALLYGIAVHSFAFFNLLHNHDNIASQPGGYGLGLELGRWFLELLGRIADLAGLNYNLPSVNGMLYVLILSVTAAFLVSTLKIRSRLSAVLIGGLFVAFPTVTATMIYRYTVIFYGFGILMAVLAVWITDRFRWNFPLSAMLIALSMGIYQAYVPVTIALFVLVLIRQGLMGEADARQLILRGLYDCAILVTGLVIYFVCMKLSLWIWEVPLTEYQGVDTMGNLSLSQIPRLIRQAFAVVCGLPLRDYCGVANRALMRLAYLALAVWSGAMVAVILVRRVKNILSSLVVCLLLPAFLLAVGFIVIMVPDGWIYTLMVYSFSLLACAPLVILECLPEGTGSRLTEKIVSLLVAMLVCFYGYYANVNYTAVAFAGEQISNYLSNVVLRATMTEGYTSDKQWVFLGQIEDPLLSSPWDDEISYTGLGFTEYLINQYSRNDWIENYIGYDLPMADEATVNRLAALEQVQQMPCWPDAGATLVLEDAVIVKFRNGNP